MQDLIGFSMNSGKAGDGCNTFILYDESDFTAGFSYRSYFWILPRKKVVMLSIKGRNIYQNMSDLDWS